MTMQEIIDKLTVPALAAELGKPAIRVYEMRQRGIIPSRYWKQVIKLAKRQGIPGVSAQTLLDANHPEEG